MSEIILPKLGKFARSGGGLIVPEQKKYERVLLFGSLGGGKSTTAEKLSAITGYPLIHGDMYRFSDKHILQPFSSLGDTLDNFLACNKQWVVDYSTLLINGTPLFRKLVNKADLILFFDYSRKASINGLINRLSGFKQGKRLVGIHNSPAYARNSDDEVNKVNAYLDLFYTQKPELLKETFKSPAEVRTVCSYAEADSVIDEFEQAFGVDAAKTLLCRL